LIRVEKERKIMSFLDADGRIPLEHGRIGGGKKREIGLLWHQNPLSISLPTSEKVERKKKGKKERNPAIPFLATPREKKKGGVLYVSALFPSLGPQEGERNQVDSRKRKKKKECRDSFAFYYYYRLRSDQRKREKKKDGFLATSGKRGTRLR